MDEYISVGAIDIGAKKIYFATVEINIDVLTKSLGELRLRGGLNDLRQIRRVTNLKSFEVANKEVTEDDLEKSKDALYMFEKTGSKVVFYNCHNIGYIQTCSDISKTSPRLNKDIRLQWSSHFEQMLTSKHIKQCTIGYDQTIKEINQIYDSEGFKKFDEAYFDHSTKQAKHLEKVESFASKTYDPTKTGFISSMSSHLDEYLSAGQGYTVATAIAGFDIDRRTYEGLL